MVTNPKKKKRVTVGNLTGPIDQAQTQGPDSLPPGPIDIPEDDTSGEIARDANSAIPRPFMGNFNGGVYQDAPFAKDTPPPYQSTTSPLPSGGAVPTSFGGGLSRSAVDKGYTTTAPQMPTGNASEEEWDAYYESIDPTPGLAPGQEFPGGIPGQPDPLASEMFFTAGKAREEEDDAYPYPRGLTDGGAIGLPEIIGGAKAAWKELNTPFVPGPIFGGGELSSVTAAKEAAAKEAAAAQMPGSNASEEEWDAYYEAKERGGSPASDNNMGASPASGINGGAGPLGLIPEDDTAGEIARDARDANVGGQPDAPLLIDSTGDASTLPTGDGNPSIRTDPNVKDPLVDGGGKESDEDRLNREFREAQVAETERIAAEKEAERIAAIALQHTPGMSAAEVAQTRTTGKALMGFAQTFGFDQVEFANLFERAGKGEYTARDQANLESAYFNAQASIPPAEYGENGAETAGSIARRDGFKARLADFNKVMGSMTDLNQRARKGQALFALFPDIPPEQLRNLPDLLIGQMFTQKMEIDAGKTAEANRIAQGKATAEALAKFFPEIDIDLLAQLPQAIIPELFSNMQFNKALQNQGRGGGGRGFTVQNNTGRFEQ